MSTVNNGPQIVRNGLVLNLDAGNGKSYSTNRFQSLGSGTVTENVTFPIQGTGTFQRVASGTVIGGYTVRPNDVVYSYALGVLGCHYHGNSAPVVAGTYATFSFDYLVTGATTYPITNYLANFEGVASGNITAANSLQNIWQRRSFTSAIISTSGNMNMYLYPGACGPTRLADSGTIYYRNPKVEITNVDTGTGGFSSTSNIGLWYDLSGNGYNGTLTNGPTSNVSNKGNILFDGVDDYITTSFTTTSGQAVSYCGWVYSTETTATYRNFIDSVTVRPMIWWNNSGQIEFDASYYTTTTVYRNQWVYVSLSKPSGNSSASYYVNGVLVGTGAAYETPALTPTLFNRGAAQTWKGNGAVVQIYNRALSATEIMQNYQATKTRFGL